MGRHKIDFGIDLGTTNSALAKMHKGKPVIVKCKAGVDTTPSCVFFQSSKREFVGRKALNSLKKETERHFEKQSGQPSGFIEFKRYMGLEDTFINPHTGEKLTPEELSAKLLREIRSYDAEEDIHSAVITIPAGFEQHQRNATKRAADLAGFSHAILLQEPIAASMAFGIESDQMSGHWLVFDFGGGTFDVALMKVDQGMMKVIDTGGDNFLGGKDVDNAILDNLILPKLRRDFAINRLMENRAWVTRLKNVAKFSAEEFKIEISHQDEAVFYTDVELGEDEIGNEIDFEYSLTRSDFEEAVRPVLQRAVDIALEMLKNNNLTGQDLEKVLAVGGTTNIPLLREMIREQITPNLDTSVDPMTCVTQGAALYASTQDNPESVIPRDRSKVQLKIKYPATTAAPEAYVGITPDTGALDETVSQPLSVEISRDDRGWSSGRISLEDGAEVVSISLNSGPNSFQVELVDSQGNRLECEPDEFTIISGFEPPKPTLTEALCPEVLKKGSDVTYLQAIRGLEKNQTLPARGKETFKTSSELIAGNRKTGLRIALYEGQPDTRAVYNSYVGAVTFTGEDIHENLPAGTEIELTISANTSGLLTVSVYIPRLDETIEKEILYSRDNSTPEDQQERLLSSIAREKNAFSEFMGEHSDALDTTTARKLMDGFTELDEMLRNNPESSDTIKQVDGRLKELCRKIDTIRDKCVWPDALKKMLEALNAYEQAVAEGKGDSQKLEEFRKKVASARQQERPQVAQQITAEIGTAIVQDDPTDAILACFLHYFQNVNTLQWSNKMAAQQKINEGAAILEQIIPLGKESPAFRDAVLQKLLPIVQELSRLLEREGVTPPEPGDPTGLLVGLLK